MNKLAEIKQKFGGNLVDEIVRYKSAINRHWSDDKGKQVSRNIEKVQKQFDEFYKETAKLFEKLAEVEKFGRKQAWPDAVNSDHWEGDNQGGFSSDYITVTTENTILGRDFPISTNNGGGRNINETSSPGSVRNEEGITNTEETINFAANSSQITSKYFDDNTLEDWENLGPDSRRDKFEKYIAEISDSSRIGIGQIIFKDMDEEQWGSFNPSSKTITLNSNILHDPEKLKIGVTTILHESRHGFQREAIENPQKYNISEETAQLWRMNMIYYNDGRDDFEAYYNQPIEADARTFADSIVNKVM